MPQTSHRASCAIVVLLAALAACHSAPPTNAPVPARASEEAPTVAAKDSSLAPGQAGAQDTATVKRDEVATEAVRIFGDSLPVTLPEETSDSASDDIDTSADASAEPAEPSWDIDVRSYEAHERVEFYVRRFTGGGRERFGDWLNRGTRYEAMIRSKLRAAGLPEDMTYLALIESGYDPHAYSRAAAVGMWQFMATTARGVGLRVDWWVDERRDPIRATDGAVKFIGWLNEQFGSLYLAAAAYNGGPGRISRGLTRYAEDLEGTSGEDVFFALAEKSYLRAETKNYVPQLVAAALIAKDPARYGFGVEQQPVFAYDSVWVGPSTPVMAAAKAAGATLAEMRDLNSALLRGVTPPKTSWWLRLPVGKGEGFEAAYDSLPEEDRRAFTRLTTKKGESLRSLASRAGVPARQLGWYNRDLRPNKRGVLPTGLAVLVPSATVLAAARDVPDPSIEIYGSSRGRTRSHVVRRGESLGLIAKKYRTTVAALKRMNGLKKSVIYPGQVIIVRGGSTRSRTPTASSATRSRASKPRTSASSGTRTHLVKRGETLTSIARKYATTPSELKELNGLRSDAIRAGQRLRVGG